MKQKPTLEDLIGIEYSKLGFFREVQEMIVELRASNLELEQKRRQLQAILDGISDVMIVITLDFRIISVNDQFFKTFPNPEPVGKLCYEVIRGHDGPCKDCPAMSASISGKVCRQIDIFAVVGSNRHFEITVSPLRNPAGDVDRILVFKRDVTTEKEYQAKYYQAERIATVGMLAAGVAHEINNPLTAVSGFTQGLKRQLLKNQGNLPESLLCDFNEYTDIILKECRRCQEIVQDLLTFSRQANGRFDPVDLNAIVQETLRLLRYRLKDCQPNLIRLLLEPELPPVNGDAPQLKQVILNIIVNALDAVNEKGTITVRTYAEGDRTLCLEVEDTGCGIPEAHLDKLFEPFFTTKPVGRGIGIGLSTCYNIIRNHGGEITVRSREGEGSLFRITFRRRVRQ